MPEEVWTIQRAAAELEVTPETLREWKENRGFPLHVVSKRTAYVICPDVLNWLRGDSVSERTMEGQAEATPPGIGVLDFTPIGCSGPTESKAYHDYLLAQATARIAALPFETDAYWYLLLDQDGRCAICQKSLIVGKGVIDHDHETMLVRGVLCASCNTREPTSNHKLFRSLCDAYIVDPPAKGRWRYDGPGCAVRIEDA